MHTRKLAVALAVAVGFAVGACGGDTRSTSTAPAAQQTSAVTQAPRTVVDSLGREVTVPNEVDSIVSLNTDLTEVLVALGVLDKIRAAGLRISTGDGWPAQHFPELSSLPSPQSGSGVNVEEIVVLDPDVVVTTLFGEVAAEEAVSALEPTGIPVVVVGMEEFATYADDIRLLATVVGAEVRAEEYIALVEGEISAVAQAVRGVSEEEKPLVYHGLTDAYSTFGATIFEADQIRVAGGINATDDLMGFGIQLGPEDLLARDPDVIVLLAEGDAAAVLADGQLRTVAAVQDGKVFEHPEVGWGFATPRAFFAIRWLASKLHPDLVDPASLHAEADRFYNAVFGIDYPGPSLTD